MNNNALAKVVAKIFCTIYLVCLMAAAWYVVDTNQTNWWQKVLIFAAFFAIGEHNESQFKKLTD